MANRIEQLHQFALEDPNDPFNWYALALEYKETAPGKAIEILNRLLTEHKEYVPAYYQLGKLYYEAGNIHEARHIFEHGVNVAQRQNELKALRELKAALAELECDS